MRGVLEQAEVHRHRTASPEPGERGPNVDGPAKGPSEIPSGAQGQHPEHCGWIDRLSSFEKPVDYLVERTVPACRDDAAISILERTSSYLRGVHWSGGEFFAKLSQRSAQLGARLQPPLTRLAVRAARVDHHEGLHC